MAYIEVFILHAIRVGAFFGTAVRTQPDAGDGSRRADLIRHDLHAVGKLGGVGLPIAVSLLPAIVDLHHIQRQPVAVRLHLGAHVADELGVDVPAARIPTAPARQRATRGAAAVRGRHPPKPRRCRRIKRLGEQQHFLGTTRLARIHQHIIHLADDGEIQPGILHATMKPHVRNRRAGDAHEQAFRAVRCVKRHGVEEIVLARRSERGGRAKPAYDRVMRIQRG